MTKSRRAKKKKKKKNGKNLRGNHNTSCPSDRTPNYYANAAFYEQHAFLGKEISAQCAIALYPKMRVELLAHNV